MLTCVQTPNADTAVKWSTENQLKFRTIFNDLFSTVTSYQLVNYIQLTTSKNWQKKEISKFENQQKNWNLFDELFVALVAYSVQCHIC